MIRVSAASNATTSLELLKYVHNLATLDVYAMVAAPPAASSSASSSAAASAAHGASGPCEGFAHFLNARGRVLFEACFSPIDAASAHWMSLGARPGTLVQRGAAGIDRAGAMVATSASEFPKQFAVASATPRGFYLTLPRAARDTALAHLQQFNLRRKIVVEDLSDSIQVNQVIPFRVLEEMRHPAGAPTTANTVAQLLDLESSEGSELSKQLGCIHAMVDPRCRSMGVRILTNKGTLRQGMLARSLTCSAHQRVPCAAADFL